MSEEVINMFKKSITSLACAIKISQDKFAVVDEENTRLKLKLEKLHDLFGLTIVEYFNECNSLRKTTEYFFFQDVRDTYYSLRSYFDCSDPVQGADDYKECYKEIFGKEYCDNEDEDEDDANEEDDADADANEEEDTDEDDDDVEDYASV
jgi:hypothetical protein